MVCDTGGNVEAGDFVCSSPVNGYCQRQSTGSLMNWTAAKIIIACEFDLDSDEYQCFELENGVKVALLPCVYKF